MAYTNNHIYTDIMAIKHLTSEGERISQDTINVRRSLAYKIEAQQMYNYVCEGCNCNMATEHSHIIPQFRCKILHKAELCYDRANWFLSCRECHQDWENKKSGKFGKLKNINELLTFLEENDPEEYRKRCIILDEL